MSRIITRRRFLIGATMTASALGLSGCDAIVESDRTKSVLKIAEGFSMKTQRFLLGDDALAREFTEADLSPVFRANGTSMPDNPQYLDWMNQQFSTWKLDIGGLVDKPMQLSLAELKALPAAPRSPGTIASKAGAPSANGPACRWVRCSRRSA